MLSGCGIISYYDISYYAWILSINIADLIFCLHYGFSGAMFACTFLESLLMTNFVHSFQQIQADLSCLLHQFQYGLLLFHQKFWLPCTEVTKSQAVEGKDSSILLHTNYRSTFEGGYKLSVDGPMAHI